MITGFDELPSSRPSPYNHAFMVATLDDDENDLRPRRNTPQPKKPLNSAVCLVERLPSTAFIQREADRLAPLSAIKQLKYNLDDDPEEEDPVDYAEEPQTPMPSPPISEPSSPVPNSPGGTVRGGLLATVSKVFKGGASAGARGGVGGGASGWKEPQPWEVMKAVERKDVMYLMEVRDRAFHLLLRRIGDATPLLHAIRIGPTHRDVAIVLIGAMSRYVNHLEDEDMDKPKTKVLLKALRTNLKLAIDSSLAVPHQSDLIASFLQTLVMSESDRWLMSQIQQVSLALRVYQGGEGKPVQTAEEAVMRFATRELGKAKGLIAAVDDYVANATADLVMMAAWSQALEKMGDAEPIPRYTFARDDRTYRAFAARLTENKVAIRQTLGKRLRWQLKVLEKVFEGRQETLRKKVDVLKGEFDGGDGAAVRDA